MCWFWVELQRYVGFFEFFGYRTKPGARWCRRGGAPGLGSVYRRFPHLKKGTAKKTNWNPKKTFSQIKYIYLNIAIFQYIYFFTAGLATPTPPERPIAARTACYRCHDITTLYQHYYYAPRLEWLLEQQQDCCYPNYSRRGWLGKPVGTWGNQCTLLVCVVHSIPRGNIFLHYSITLTLIS